MSRMEDGNTAAETRRNLDEARAEETRGDQGAYEAMREALKTAAKNEAFENIRAYMEAFGVDMKMPSDQATEFFEALREIHESKLDDVKIGSIYALLGFADSVIEAYAEEIADIEMRDV